MPRSAKRDKGGARLTRRERTAYHEAGHGVMAFLEGVPVSQVSIVEDEESYGRVLHKSLIGASIEYDSGSRNRQAVEKHLKVCLAGTIAEWLASGRTNWRGAEGDITTVATVAQYVFGQEEVLNAYVHFLKRLVTAELKANHTWRAVTAVATALLERGRVSGRALRRIIREALLPPGIGPEVKRVLAHLAAAE